MTKGLTQAVSMKQILDLVQDDLKHVEKAIGLETVASVGAIKTISHHMQSAGGKRLRHGLVDIAMVLLVPNQVRFGGIGAVKHVGEEVFTDEVEMLRIWQDMRCFINEAFRFSRTAIPRWPQ